ncbi:MAG: ABC transporter substrate-binding protein [Frigidibacter sp.]|nr:ABC transporter substrate-binding protein [Frigidibacter sp.]MDP3339963.1 ABC transporter substrate-binding protein [Frigidibacter sp.]
MIALCRILCIALISTLLAPGARAEMFLFPAPSGTAAQEILVYSSLDERLAAPLIAGFQTQNPDIAVRYEDLLTGEIHARITAETDAGQRTADFAFSSAMDLQVKLVNDGYAIPVTAPETDDWPDWANWRDTAYAMTFEPAVFVYHKPDFQDAPPPATRAEFLDWMRTGANVQGRIGTYDIERSGVGYLFLARDQEHFPDIWSVVRAMGAAGVQQFPTSEDILVRISDGRLAMGYNILGSYAADWAREHPDVGLVLPRDYTVVASRIGLVPRAARSPDLGARMLGFFLSRAGQTILAEELRLPAVSLEVSERNSARAMQDTLGGQLRPVPVSPGLLVYLDQAKRARLIARWKAALAGQ